MALSSTNNSSKVRFHYLFFTFFSFLCCSSLLQAKDTKSPQVSALHKELDELFASGLKQKIPGIIALVETPETRYLKAMGVADRKTKLPMKDDNLLRIASISKTYVAALALQLLEEKNISLSAPVYPYLSEQILQKLPNDIAPTSQ